MARLTLKGLGKRFGTVEAVRDLDLEIADGEFVVFVGPSGCGKSTLLRLIAGLEEADAGSLAFDGEPVDHLPPAERGVAMVFQSYALYPHMTVFDNMAFGLRLGRLGRGEIAARVEAAARILKIESLLGRKPRQLSGGQRQRVAIGRAIVREPRVFLFDEPLSNLDAGLRAEMRIELARLHRRLRATMVYVTHDQMEAMTLARRIVVLNEGRAEQVGTPRELYESPVNRFVAGFIGAPRMNFIEVTLRHAGDAGVVVELPGGSHITIPADSRGIDPGAPLALGVRPEHLTRGPGIVGEVAAVEPLGAETLVHVELPGGTLAILSERGRSTAHPGDRLEVVPSEAHCHLFDAAGRALPRPDP